MVFCPPNFIVSKTPRAALTLKDNAEKIVNVAAETANTIEEFTKKIQDKMETTSSFGWHVISSPDFAVDLRYRKGQCLLLSNKTMKMKVLLYRTTTVDSPIEGSNMEDIVENNEIEKRILKGQKFQILFCRNERLKEYVTSIAAQLGSEYKDGESADTSVAKQLKVLLTSRYGTTWHVIVFERKKKREMKAAVYYDADYYIEFLVASHHIIAYRHAGVPIDWSSDILQLGNRAALTFAGICFVIYIFFAVSESNEGNDKAQSWKYFVMWGMVLLTGLASLLRMYRSSLIAGSKKIKTRGH